MGDITFHNNDNSGLSASSLGGQNTNSSADITLNNAPVGGDNKYASLFNQEFIDMMNEMGIHPMEQWDIKKDPVAHMDEIEDIRHRIKEKKKQEKMNDTQAHSSSNSISLNSLNNEVQIGDILDSVIEYEASDLHIGVDARIALRIDGAIHFIDNLPPLTKEQGERIILSLVEDKRQRETLMRTKELDCSYEHDDGTFFRVNIFFKRKRMSAVLRRIATKTYAMADLGMPKSILKLLKAKQGLILVTGPTGSGKSTSMQTMLNYINENRVEHIVTIEDPIEFVFTNKKSVFSQREVGADTLSFANALRGAMRQDPDVVMIGEMRDPETIMSALNLSETGHLVFSTLHTSGAPQTVSRIVNAFPPDEQSQVQARLADSLIGVVSQRLVPKASGKGRCAIYEIMLVNSGIRNIVRTGDLGQLDNAILSGRKEGMIKMQDYANVLRNKGIIMEKDYINFFREE